MKRFFAMLLCLCLTLGTLPALGAAFADDLPDDIADSLAKTAAFKDFEVNAWAEIGNTGYIFVSLHKDKTNRLVAYQLKSSGWKRAFYTDTAMMRGDPCTVWDASGLVMLDSSVSKNAVGFRQEADDGEAWTHAVIAELSNGHWYVHSYSTNQPKKVRVSIRSNQLTFYNPDTWKVTARVNGVVQNDLQYFVISALPKTAAAAREKLSTAPEIPQSSDLSVTDVKFTGKKKYSVYSGPGEWYVRAAKGKAAVSTNDWIQVFGTESDYVLIQYAISGGQMRFGYIEASALPKNANVPALDFYGISATVTRDTSMTDDPLGKQGTVQKLAAGTVVTCLARLDGWQYIEVPGVSPERGFVPAAALEAAFQAEESEG